MKTGVHFSAASVLLFRSHFPFYETGVGQSTDSDRLNHLLLRYRDPLAKQTVAFPLDKPRIAATSECRKWAELLGLLTRNTLRCQRDQVLTARGAARPAQSRLPKNLPLPRCSKTDIFSCKLLFYIFCRKLIYNLIILFYWN